MAAYHDIVIQVIRNFTEMGKVVNGMKFDADHDSAKDVVEFAAHYASSYDFVADGVKGFLDAKGVDYSRALGGDASIWAASGDNYIEVAKGLLDAYLSHGYFVKEIEMDEAAGDFQWMWSYLHAGADVAAMSKHAAAIAGDFGVAVD